MIPHSSLSRCAKVAHVHMPLLVSLICVILVGYFCFLPDAFSAQVTLSWDPPSTNTDGTPLIDLDGYKLYYGAASRSYSQVIDVSNINTYTVTNLSGGTYYFAVTAYDMSGNESNYSNEVSKTVQIQYTLAVNRTGNGTVTGPGIDCGSDCSEPYNQGSVITLNATPNSGSSFTGWSGGGCSGMGQCVLTMNMQTNVTATFTNNSYTITASAGTGGSISPSGPVSVSQGASQTFTITPNTGYSIADVKVDNTSVGAVTSYTFSNVTAAHTIQASFSIVTYTITASAGSGGSISPAGSVSVSHGASQTFNITPNTGSLIANVTVDGVSQGAISSYTFTAVTANHTISASFAINTHTINALAGTGGSISPSGSVSVNQGGSQAFTITPNSGYRISDVIVDGISVGAVSSYTFSNVSSNHSISANFSPSNAVTEEWGDTPGSNHHAMVEDTFINLNSENYAIFTQLNTYTWPTNSVANAILLKWDLSAIPSGSTIINAAVSLYLQGYEGSGGDDAYDISVHKLINRNMVISQATGYNSNASTPWTPFVGLYNNVPLAQSDIAPPEDLNTIDKTLGYKSWNVTNMVQDWVNDSSSNYGMLLNSDLSAIADSNRYFSSTDHPEAGQRPKLVVTYVPAEWSYAITASAGTGGSISPSGSVSVNQGGNQAFTITPNSGYRISDVTVDGASVGAVTSYTFSNVTAVHTIQTSFSPITYTIASSAGSGGSISPAGSVSVSHGASQTFNITPNTGSLIANVTVDGVSQGAISSYTFTAVTANHTISASFAINTHAITASAGTGGRISPSGSVSVNHGASQSFTITPNTGYRITDVKVDNISVGAVTSYTFSNVTAAHTIQASFSIVTYTITASAGTGGRISPSGSVSVNRGTSQAFTITPNTGYRITDVKVDNTSVGAVTSYTFSNVTATHTIQASFSIVTYTITASAGTGGRISPSGSVSVNQGASKTFTITPNTGYRITDVKVDNTSVGAVTSYTFSNVTATHTIQASFSIVTYTITASAGTGGSISPSGSVSVNQGASKTFTITPNTGYRISNVKVDNTSVGAVTSYTFFNVTATHTIQASFSIVTYTITASAGTGGSISPSGSVSVNQGTSQTFTITPNTGYRIADVKVDNTSVGAVTSYTFSNVTATHTIQASFSPLTQVTLSWDAPTTNTDGTSLTDLAGYKVYYGAASRSYSQVIDVSNTNTYTFANLSDGTFYFAVTAYDMSGNESGYSNEVTKTSQ